MSEPLEASSTAPVASSEDGEIPSFNGDEKAKASDFANYFCSYAQLHHQKQMLADHNRMAAYHSAILGNPDVFKDKVVMDIGTGSGILAIWAAQAGARKVYASESYVMVICFPCIHMAMLLTLVACT
jgi:type I protein arginine methyltransferase